MDLEAVDLAVEDPDVVDLEVAGESLAKVVASVCVRIESLDYFKNVGETSVVAIKSVVIAVV